MPLSDWIRDRSAHLVLGDELLQKSGTGKIRVRIFATSELKCCDLRRAYQPSVSSLPSWQPPLHWDSASVRQFAPVAAGTDRRGTRPFSERSCCAAGGAT